MPSPTRRIYQQGRAFEYRVADLHKRCGWVVIRSSGSHSPVDLVCARAGEIRLIQCKANDGYMTPVEITHAKEVAREFGCLAWKAFKNAKHHIEMEVL